MIKYSVNLKGCFQGAASSPPEPLLHPIFQSQMYLRLWVWAACCCRSFPTTRVPSPQNSVKSWAGPFLPSVPSPPRPNEICKCCKEGSTLCDDRQMVKIARADRGKKLLPSTVKGTKARIPWGKYSLPDRSYQNMLLLWPLRPPTTMVPTIFKVSAAKSRKNSPILYIFQFFNQRRHSLCFLPPLFEPAEPALLRLSPQLRLDLLAIASMSWENFKTFDSKLRGRDVFDRENFGPKEVSTNGEESSESLLNDILNRSQRSWKIYETTLRAMEY